MDRIILGIDAGNHSAKVVGAFGTDKFKSNICEWFERDIIESFNDDDMEFEIMGRRGFAGTIAKYEDEFGDGALYGDTKAHDDTKIRVLLAIDRYLNKYCPHITRISIVVGQPIKRHKDGEKNKIKEMLIGKHTITVNDRTRTFIIEHVGVAPEGSTAYWSNPVDGLCRLIDCGSGTINAATIEDNRHINNASDTFNFGAETVINKADFKGMARGIINGTTKLKWNKADKVFVCGGIAEKVMPFIKDHYPNAELLTPQIKNGNDIKVYDAVYGNAVGFYVVGKGTFK